MANVTRKILFLESLLERVDICTFDLGQQAHNVFDESAQCDSPVPSDDVAW